jgi:hypothetical protein
MAEIPASAAFPPGLVTAGPIAAMTASLNLLNRRTGALAEFWRSCADVREPSELMALQLNYWTRLVDDYQEALSAGLTQAAATATVADAPQPAARSA